MTHADRVADWFAGRSSTWRDWPLDRLLAEKGDRTISVVLPARDEGATVGAIVAGIHDELMVASQLVDELLVIDSDSTDDTAAQATAAGAVVRASAAICPELGTYAGKGEAIWKAQLIASGDILVFVDADLTGWGTHFVRGLVGPLLELSDVALVKGFYRRPAAPPEAVDDTQGGRVTELVARPLLNLYWPELAQVVQPLAGEWAIRRDTLARLAVPIGYGVEMATLLDVYCTLGLDAIAQVDLGQRTHRHQPVHDLGVMAAEIIAVEHRRRLTSPARTPSGRLLQYARGTGWRTRVVPLTERPPLGDHGTGRR